MLRSLGSGFLILEYAKKPTGSRIRAVAVSVPALAEKEPPGNHELRHRTKDWLLACIFGLWPVRTMTYGWRQLRARDVSSV